MNAIPGKICGCFASPFLLIHGIGHDPCTWVPIFSLCYFHHKKDGDLSWLKHQAHTMDGIIVGRSSTSNALLVYNSRNKQYYEPDSYRIDYSRLPSLVYHDMKYDGGLFCQLLWDENPLVEEPYPPGTRVEQVNPAFNRLLARMFMDIPFPSPLSDPALPPSYSILFNKSTSASIPLLEMVDIIPKPPVAVAPTNPRPVPSSRHFYSSILKSPMRMTTSITRDTSQKLMGSTNFSFKSHINKRKEEWGVPLPNLPSTTWVDLCVQGILIPGHIPHSFSILPLHLAAPPSIWLLPLSAPSTFIMIALVLYSSLWLIPTLIVRFGWKATRRRSRGFRAWTLIVKSLLVNTECFVRREHPKQFQQCVF